MTATRTDIAPPLSRIAIAIADYLIPLSPEQRDDVIVRALCVVDDSDKPIPYAVTDKADLLPMLDGKLIPMTEIPVTAADYPAPFCDPARPSRGRVASQRRAASSAIEAAARSIVEVLSGHPEGMTKGALATALNFESMNRRFVAALHAVTHSGRIRAIGVTNARRYFPAIKGA